MKSLATNPKSYYGFGGVIFLLVEFGKSHCSVPVQDWYSLASTAVPMALVAVGAFFHGKGKA